MLIAPSKNLWEAGHDIELPDESQQRPLEKP